MPAGLKTRIDNYMPFCLCVEDRFIDLTIQINPVDVTLPPRNAKSYIIFIDAHFKKIKIAYNTTLLTGMHTIAVGG